MKSTILTGLCSLLLILSSHAQTYDLSLAAETAMELKVTGTSTLHDWTVTSAKVEQVPSQITLKPGAQDLISNFAFSVPVSDLDGGRGASMNSKIKTAFKSESHPNITFKQSGSKLKNANGDQIEFTSSGTLSMAGVEKEVSVDVLATKEGDQWTFSGQHQMNMSDFNMEPPTAMFGQIKTHDPVVVHFTFKYQIKTP